MQCPEGFLQSADLPARNAAGEMFPNQIRGVALFLAFYACKLIRDTKGLTLE
jgi:hypothetical protein